MVQSPVREIRPKSGVSISKKTRLMSPESRPKTGVMTLQDKESPVLKKRHVHSKSVVGPLSKILGIAISSVDKK